MEKPCVRVSVRNLVEFILRSGDLDQRAGAVSDQEAMLAGGRIHRKIQKGMKGAYESEVVLSEETAFDDLTLRVEGRADGILDGEPVTVDEIKGVYLKTELITEPVPVHLAQAKCYAAMLLHRDGLQNVGVRMTYVNLDTEEIRYFSYAFEKEELDRWYAGLTAAYHKWATFSLDHAAARNASMENLRFPFPYRSGQRDLVAAVYRTIQSGKELFIEAPTGIGKTMSTVYPAVRALGEGLGDRIFYLTSKTVTRTVGLEAFRILQEKGLVCKVSVLTAKEKICPLSEPSCTPEDCPYAKGHFDRINDAVFELLEGADVFDRETILLQAEKRQVCPFELSLDTASWTDAVICDYNYAFDPNAHLKRFFQNGVRNDAILLIDEAHNLVDRGREMFSARIVKEHVLAAKKAVKTASPALAKSMEKVNRQLLELKHECDTYEILPTAGMLELSLLRLMGEMDTFFKEKADEEERTALRDFYFEVRDFVSVSELVDENYVVYSELDEDGEFSVRLFCVNPAQNLQKTIGSCRSAVFFSATLFPISYYRKLLSTNEEDYAVYAQSPFAPEQKKLLVGRDISTRYRTRGHDSYARIAQYIHDTVRAQKGNYLAFFPSYRMMEDVFAVYREEFDEEGINWVVQTPSMREDDREIFLENFYENPKDSLVGFCVMGGIFAEGIDLIGTRLIGAVIIGTGLPQISNEKEILRNYYDGKGEDGFAFAYRISGMNKVLQAAGRVIRTADDRGVILLLDDRFLSNDYRALFPREWKDFQVCRAEEVKEALKAFWDMV